jgi:hypothetical protein
MGQAWYGVPANGEGDAALLRQANDLNSSPTNNASSAASTGAVDPAFVQKLIEEAAAQVYEDVHLQLKNIQEESLQKTEQMTKQLQARLKPLERRDEQQRTLCLSQRSVLLQCLQEQNQRAQQHPNSHAALLCEDAVNAYQACALSS